MCEYLELCVPVWISNSEQLLLSLDRTYKMTPLNLCVEID